MNEAAPFLPHEPPAIMLEAFESWDSEQGPGLRGTVCLGDCGLRWMTARGLPCAFALEILGQLSAVLLRRSESGESLSGGRLAMVDSFAPATEWLPATAPLDLRLIYLGGSSAGYHKFDGEIRTGSGELLAEARFSVLAFTA